MKYIIPVIANARKLFPTVEKIFTEVEQHVNSFTMGIDHGFTLSCRPVVMNITVTTPIELTIDQLGKLRAEAGKQIAEKFPDCEIEIGEAKLEL